MMKILLGDFKNGRLARLPYLGYSFLLAIIFVGSMLAVVTVIAGAEKVIGGNLQDAQQILRENFTGVFLVVLGIFVVAFVFMHANIAAKRVRDMGLPGWWIVLAFVAISGVLSVLVSQNAGSIISTIAWLALLLIPGGMFKKG